MLEQLEASYLVFEQEKSLTLCLSNLYLCDNSEKSLVSDKGTGVLPDCGRNQDKTACVLSSLSFSSLIRC